MKFGVNTWMWVSPFTTQDVALISKVESMGFDAIEIAAEDWSEINVDAVGNVLRDSTLEVTVGGAFGPDRDLIHDDVAIRNNAFHYIEESIINTEKLGGTIFSGPLYSQEGRARYVSPDQRAVQVERFVSAMTRLMKIAGDCGVVLCIEPANRFETNFVNTVDDALMLINLVDHPMLGILLDMFHMGIEEPNFGDAIRSAGSRLMQIHACENNRGIPGTGSVPWQHVKAALRDIGYDGHVTIESFTSDSIALVEAAAMWRPLAPSQDQFAQDGLKFLRQLFLA